MGAIRELIPNEKYLLTYRFRYYKDDKVFDSEDTKNWYEGTVSGTRNYVVQSFRQVANKLAAKAIEPLYELMNDGDLGAFVKKIDDARFMFRRRVSQEEWERMEKEAGNA
jgi:hypothetical protein